MKRILVIRACAVGDFVLNFPAFLALGEALNEDVRFTFAGYPSTLSLVHEFLPEDWIETIASIETPPWSSLFAGPLPDLHFDLAVIWMKDRTVAHNVQRSGIADVRALDPFPAAGHAAEHLLRTLNLTAPALPDQWRGGGGGVILHPGSGSPAKNWPHFHELATRMKATIGDAAFLMGPSEDRFQTPMRTLENLSLREVARELRNCRLFIGNDSGITHLSAYLGTPTIALFGPTDPQVWGPWGRRVTVIRNPHLAQIAVDDVLEYARRIMGG